jgi:Transposase IS66 family
MPWSFAVSISDARHAQLTAPSLWPANRPFLRFNAMGRIASSTQLVPISILPSLEWIAAIYAIESRIRGRSAEERPAVRQAETKPLVEKLKAWLENRLLAVSEKSTIAEAIHCGSTVGTAWGASSTSCGRFPGAVRTHRRAIEGAAVRGARLL